MDAGAERLLVKRKEQAGVLREVAAERFGKDRVVEDYLRVYRRLLGAV